MDSRISGLEDVASLLFWADDDEWGSFLPEVTFDAHKKVHMPVPLQLTSARLRSSPTLPHVHVRGCGQERLPDLLSFVCLPAAVPL